MSVSAINLGIRPLVYDAWSHEFLPHTDPEARLHTLARLAFQTTIKGESASMACLPLPAQKERYSLNKYYPSWAPVVATSYVASGGINYISGLRILAKSGPTRELAVYDATTNEGLAVHLKTPGQYGITLPLSVGAELQHAREQIAEATQTFFDRLVQV